MRWGPVEIRLIEELDMNEEIGATAEIEVAEKEVIEQPKSMDDTIRESLRAIQSRDEPEQATETPEAPEEKAQRIRDEKGKFAAKETAQVAEPAAIDQPSPPNTWKKEAHQAWIKADPIIRAEVERREADFHRGIEQYKGKAQFGESIERAMAPYQDIMRSLGVTPDKAVGELMAADKRLRSGDISYFVGLADAYKFDRAQLAQIFSGQRPQQQQIDPNLDAVQQRVRQLEGYIQQRTMMEQQQEEATLNSEVSAFASDPSHSHFESVRDDMAALLQAGVAKDLKDAYEQAIWRNPTVRAALLAQQQEKAKQEATQKAQAAKKAASVNVTRRPSMPVSQPIGTMDETIRQTLRRLQNA